MILSRHKLIIDNSILSYETFKYIKNNKKGNKGCLAMNLDMENAYDRIKWYFIYNTLRKFGFPNNILDVIMRFVTTITFSILINDYPSNTFYSSKGISQRDHLSP